MTLTVSSFARRRRVTVWLDGRRLGAFVALPSVYTKHKVKLGRLRAGAHELRLRSSPGPQSIKATTGVPDARSVSIRLREPVVLVGQPRR
jgi:hypothetical protein